MKKFRLIIFSLASSLILTMNADATDCVNGMKQWTDEKGGKHWSGESCGDSNERSIKQQVKQSKPSTKQSNEPRTSGSNDEAKVYLDKDLKGNGAGGNTHQYCDSSIQNFGCVLNEDFGKCMFNRQLACMSSQSNSGSRVMSGAVEEGRQQHMENVERASQRNKDNYNSSLNRDNGVRYIERAGPDSYRVTNPNR